MDYYKKYIKYKNKYLSLKNNNTTNIITNKFKFYNIGAKEFDFDSKEYISIGEATSLLFYNTKNKSNMIIIQNQVKYF